MRRLVYGLLLAGALTPAAAADFDTSWLRGSTTDLPTPHPYQVWSGFYGGGQVGEDFYGIDFRNVVGNSIQTISSLDANFNGIPLSNFPHLSVVNLKGPAFGGFAGYNYQLDDLVLGLELNFNRSTFNANLNDSESHNYLVNTNSTLYITRYNVTTTASADLADYGTIRARFGWAYGNFLPYAFIGASLAQIDTSRSVNVSYSGQQSTPTNPPAPAIGGNWTLADGFSGKWTLGFAVGAGLDYAITHNIFLRGEFEYLQLGSPDSIKMNTASARVGAGLKF
jgi:outer membrane immunogenic protein